jgi:oligopeptide/dipeptide ABC transporter ATP-binding protein
MGNVVEIEELRTWFQLEEGTLKAVDGVSLAVAQKRTLGIIGESGCGKSVTAQSILRIVPAPGRIVRGRILFSREDGVPVDLASLDGRGPEIRAIRGKDISMIFQEPMTSLSPVHTIGNQVMEAILLHRTQDTFQAREIAIEMLARVGISNPAQRFHEYPHQLSGGMRQRAMIAMALSCHPALLIADEPTTALDVTVQAQILELIKELQEALGMSVLYITHDLGVIAEIADEVAVMYLGRVVEQGTAHDIFKNPMHPYTSLLLKSIPKLGRKARVRLEAIKGTVPMPLNPPWQCGFWSRCPERIEGRCDQAVPALVERERGSGAGGHRARCFLRGGEEEPRAAEPEAGGRRRRPHREPAAPIEVTGGGEA